jgi:hypothetical protein
VTLRADNLVGSPNEEKEWFAFNPAAFEAQSTVLPFGILDCSPYVEVRRRKSGLAGNGLYVVGIIIKRACNYPL